MNRKKLIAFLIILALAFAVFKWPMNFDKFFAGNGDILILQINNGVINGVPFSETKRYIIVEGSDNYVEIQKLFSEHSFSKRFQSLFEKSAFKGDKGGVSFVVSFVDGDDLTELRFPYENGGLIVNNRIYSLSDASGLVSDLVKLLENVKTEE
ncbi:MAG: hypothetical protein IIW34_06030 [Clostridia bacterium]|nr:hypothetical protein [Clostridia bacterium]